MVIVRLKCKAKNRNRVTSHSLRPRPGFTMGLLSKESLEILKTCEPEGLLLYAGRCRSVPGVAVQAREKCYASMSMKKTALYIFGSSIH